MIEECWSPGSKRYQTHSTQPLKGSSLRSRDIIDEGKDDADDDDAGQWFEQEGDTIWDSPCIFEQRNLEKTPMGIYKTFLIHLFR